MNRFNRRIDFGGLVFGVIILFVGGYYVLRNTLGLDLGELDWEPIWPVLLVLLGGGIVLGVFTRPHGNEPRT